MRVVSLGEKIKNQNNSRSFYIDTVSCINDLKLFSDDKLFVLVVCSDDIPNVLCSSMMS